MPVVTTRDNVKINYVDQGEGRPVVLSHGWPLSGESFAANRDALLKAGYRVVTYDRRGFGDSDKPVGGYEYDTLADDLNALITHLDLRDAVILGFSMGGGDVVRYLTRYGNDRIAGLVLSGAVTPALGITDDNPDGAMPLSAFEDMAQQMEQDPAGFLDGFMSNFFSNDDGIQVSEDVRQAALQIGAQADVSAAAACIRIWPTDLRQDCEQVSVPTLIIHGDGDQNVPLGPSGKRAHEIISDSELRVIPGGTHGANISHQSEWEGALVRFLASL